MNTHGTSDSPTTRSNASPMCELMATAASAPVSRSSRPKPSASLGLASERNGISPSLVRLTDRLPTISAMFGSPKMKEGVSCTTRATISDVPPIIFGPVGLRHELQLFGSVFRLFHESPWRPDRCPGHGMPWRPRAPAIFATSRIVACLRIVMTKPPPGGRPEVQHDGKHGRKREFYGFDEFRGVLLVHQPLQLDAVHDREHGFRRKLCTTLILKCHLFALHLPTLGDDLPERICHFDAQIVVAFPEKGVSRIVLGNGFRREHRECADQSATMRVEMRRVHQLMEASHPLWHGFPGTGFDLLAVPVFKHLDEQIILGPEIVKHPCAVMPTISPIFWRVPFVNPFSANTSSAACRIRSR